MKHVFPIYLAIITINIVLFVIITKREKQWSQMTSGEKKISLILITIGSLILISGIAALFLTS